MQMAANCRTAFPFSISDYFQNVLYLVGLYYNVFEKIEMVMMYRIYFWLFIFAGDVQVSTYPGRIIVTENPKGFVQPRINVDKHSMRHVVMNGQTMLPCIAQGHPVPTYR